MTTTIIVLLVILIILASIFGGSKKQRYRHRGNFKTYGRYKETKQQREQERAIRYMERQQKSAERYAKRHEVGFNPLQKKSPYEQKFKRKFK